MFCKNCGSEIDDNSSFCPKCGTKLISDEEKQKDTGHEGEAIAGFVLGLVSLLLGFTIIMPILGIYFSNKGKNSSKASFAKVGKILSIISFLPAIILIVFVGATTATAVTAKIMSHNSSPASTFPITEEYSGDREIYDWYSSLGSIRTITCDDTPALVTVDVVLGYKKDDKAVSTEITSRNIEIVNFIRRFFEKKTVNDLKPENEDTLREEIVKEINEKILTSTKIKDVRFKQFDVVQK